MLRALPSNGRGLQSHRLATGLYAIIFCPECIYTICMEETTIYPTHLQADYLCKGECPFGEERIDALNII
jgi:hypothetical protein